MSYYTETNPEQSRQIINTRQLFETSISLKEKLFQYKGSMVWRKIRDNEYLYRLHDAAGNGKSIGRRTLEKESIKNEFYSKKKELKGRKSAIDENLKRQAKYNKAAQINRVPLVAAAILKTLKKFQLNKRFCVVGTYALYAYEAMAGIQFMSDITATEDIDLLWDGSKKIKLVTDLPVKSLIELLQKADKTFVKNKSYSAVNKDGFLVDIIRAEPNSPWKKVDKTPFENNIDEIEPSVIASLNGLNSSPKIMQCVIAQNGFPVMITVPDPRSFVIHKLWLSEEKNRIPEKRRRDRMQAIATAEILKEFLPQYRFTNKHLMMFPKKVFEEGIIKLQDVDV